jgi:GMP synthase-like glutamine amidotransferase
MRAQDNSPASPRSARLSVLIGPDHMPATAGDRRIDAEIEWARRTDQAGTPILGIGLGARVLASALGGGVEPTDHGHRGWTFLDTSVPHFIAGGPWLTWQHGTIRLPPDAELLAHNRHGPQAFRAGRHLGLRFAPEASQDQAAAWRAADDGSVEYHDTLTATRRDPSAARECARRLILKFLETTTS